MRHVEIALFAVIFSAGVCSTVDAVGGTPQRQTMTNSPGGVQSLGTAVPAERPIASNTATRKWAGAPMKPDILWRGTNNESGSTILYTNNVRTPGEIPYDEVTIAVGDHVTTYRYPHRAPYRAFTRGT